MEKIPITRDKFRQRFGYVPADDVREIALYRTAARSPICIFTLVDPGFGDEIQMLEELYAKK